MPFRNKGIAVVFATILSLACVNSACAQIACKDVKYDSPNYRKNMDDLAKRAGLAGHYWSRNHESVVRDLCSGDIKDIDKLVDAGQVKAQEAQNIAKVLGKTYKPNPRSETGKSFGAYKEKFLDMGACEACADNIAQYYTKNPDSPCGKLAKQALEGNSDAISKLVSFPDYCKWKY